MKKALSILFALLVLMLCAVPAFSAADDATDPGYIYFAVPTEGAVRWNGFKTVYCHIWSKTGGDIHGWQEKAERCEDLGNGYWRYDMSTIDFDPESEYSLIFSNEIGMQTYNLNVTSSCLGDIAYCEGDIAQNPVDGQKSCAVARWTHSGDKVHPAIEMNSNGVLLNVDEIDADEAETLWGESEGASYELPAVAAMQNEPEQETTEKLDEQSEETVNVDEKAEKEDGINLTATTTWIIVVCSVSAVAIIALVIILARKNRKK